MQCGEEEKVASTVRLCYWRSYRSSGHGVHCLSNLMAGYFSPCLVSSRLYVAATVFGEIKIAHGNTPYSCVISVHWRDGDGIQHRGTTNQCTSYMYVM
jgi:hypothetical protein